MSLESESRIYSKNWAWSTSQPARWRSGADGCHFTCCCKCREQRLGCLQRHVIWHLKKYETIPLPPLSTIQLVDREVVRSALQSLPQGTLPKNEENKNENLHETEVTSSSCDEDKNEQIKENRNKATKPTVTAAGGHVSHKTPN